MVVKLQNQFQNVGSPAFWKSPNMSGAPNIFQTTLAIAANLEARVT